MGNKYTWNKDKAVKYIREVGSEDNPPTRAEFDEHGNAPLQTIISLFDGWGNALEAAGYKTRPNKYTGEELIEQLQTITGDDDTPPTSNEFLQHPDTATLMPVYRVFDSWENFVQTAGYEPRTTRSKKYTNEELIEQIQLVGEDVGGRPTSKQFREHPDTTNSTVVYEYFGSWNNAVEAAGYERKYETRSYSREELLDQLDMVAETVGADNLTSITFREHDDTAALTTITREFGSWTAFMEEGGYEPGTSEEWDETTLTAVIADMMRENGAEPTADEFIAYENAPDSLTPIRRVFGSWNDAVTAATNDMNTAPDTQTHDADETPDTQPGDPDSDSDTSGDGDDTAATDGGIAHVHVDTGIKHALSRAASQVTGELTPEKYGEWREETNARVPPARNIIEHVGSWAHACNAAGVTPE